MNVFLTTNSLRKLAAQFSSGTRWTIGPMRDMVHSGSLLAVGNCTGEQFRQLIELSSIINN